MILAAVDDLLFSSKIRATARQAGIEIAFARTPPEILERARAVQPSLIIFDLDSAKAEPVSTIAALKQDPATSSIRTIGFVSHVHTALIGEARRAGADEVMARSTFAGHLPEILQAEGTKQP
jgi:PleD family two-component response regulator